MKLKLFLNDKIWFILLFSCIYGMLLLTFFAFKLNGYFIFLSSLLLLCFFIGSLAIEYVRKRSFYTQLLNNVRQLDKAYFVLETMEKPEFYEGEMIYQCLYEINKSMTENVKVLEEQMNDFKEFIEMWIHEVKIPISSLVLMNHNHNDQFDSKYLEQMKRIEDYVEQVLYYVRAENAENDYLIKEIALRKIINTIALKYKDDLLLEKIDLEVSLNDTKVYTDSKWLEFILNQIISNSIKYKRNIKNSYIRIVVKENKDIVKLIVEDNGIGIPSSDLSRVFDKSFTGTNGRMKAKSTGMGLFIAKSLCTKLGHKIEIESKVNDYTRVIITFARNHYYDVVK